MREDTLLKDTKIEDLSEANCIEIFPFFALNLQRTVGLAALPIKFVIEKKD